VNSERANRDDELPDSDVEATSERAPRRPEQPSLVIRAIQFLLGATLIAIVVHGLLTRSPNDKAPPGHSVRTSPTAAHDVISAPSTSNANAPSSSSRSPVASASTAAPTCDRILSLHDIRDYLELHRVTRETRAYQLALTSRDAFVQFAITSEPKQ